MIDTLWILLAIYYACINLYGGLLMRLDKQRALQHAYRISERRLFRMAWLGGAWGIYASMYMFHHKTKHGRFVWGIPLIGVLQLVCGLLLYLGVSRVDLPIDFDFLM